MSEVGEEVAALTQAELPAEDLEEASMETVVPRQGNKARVSIEGVKAVVSTRELGEAVAASTQAELPVEDLVEALMEMVVPRQADKVEVSMEVVKAVVSTKEAHSSVQLEDLSALAGLMVELSTPKARASMMMER